MDDGGSTGGEPPLGHDSSGSDTLGDSSSDGEASADDSANMCVSHANDDPPGAEVAFEIVNTGTTPLYIESANGSECFVAFDLRNSAGDPVAWMPVRHPCFARCDDLASECSSNCLGQGECNGTISGLTIAPGSRFRAIWAGLRAEVLTTVAESCALHEFCAPGSCLRFAAPSVGTHRVTVTTGRSLYCELPPCECEPGPDGWCEWTQFPGLVDAEPSSLEFDPNDAGVVVFEL